MRLSAIALVLLPAVAFSQGLTPTPYSKAAVASDSAIASQVGADIMRKGGNAVDAAVATAFALAVTYPQAGNIGGGGFMLVRMADGRSVFIDYREIAPAAAFKTMYATNPKESLVGYRAAGVPGTVAGMAEAHRRFGKLKWRDVVEPARKLASEGFIMTPGLSGDLTSSRTRMTAFASTKRAFYPGAKAPESGARFVQKDLGATLGRIAQYGAKGFYEGETARLIAADMRRQKGWITLADLKAYRVAVRQPLKGGFRGDVILTAPPPSSGGVAILQMLQMLEGDDLKALGWGSSAHIHLMAECQRRAFADRSEYMGDPGFVKIPLADMLKRDYALRLRASIDPHHATPRAEIKAGSMMKPEGMHTTHFSVVDGQGNAVSNTYTLNTGFGSMATVEGAGFLLNNEMDDFTTQLGKPNAFGLIQGEQNAPEPGKRPLSSMSPTIVVRDGKVALVLGSPGGPTIINTVLQTYLNVKAFEMNVQRAVSAPRFHHQWLPDQIACEPFGMSADTKKELEAMGHKIVQRGTMGSCMAIAIDPKSGRREVGVDPRIQDAGCAGF